MVASGELSAVVLSLRDVSFFRPDLGLSRRSLTYRQNSGSGRNSSSDHPDLTTADCLTGAIYICGWLLTHGAALRIWTLSVVLQKGNYERPRCKNFEFVYDLLPTINLCQRRTTTAHVRIYCAYPATRTIGQVLGTEQSIIVGSFPFYLGCRCCPYFCASNSPLSFLIRHSPGAGALGLLSPVWGHLFSWSTVSDRAVPH